MCQFPPHCTKEMPLNFSVNNISHQGFLDPQTFVVFPHGTPADCDDVAVTPIKLHKKSTIVIAKMVH